MTTKANSDNSSTPLQIRCRWMARPKERGVYDCPDCKSWTANKPLYSKTVCPAKERRTAKVDRRER